MNKNKNNLFIVQVEFVPGVLGPIIGYTGFCPGVNRESKLPRKIGEDFACHLNSATTSTIDSTVFNIEENIFSLF